MSHGRSARRGKPLSQSEFNFAAFSSGSPEATGRFYDTAGPVSVASILKDMGYIVYEKASYAQQTKCEEDLQEFGEPNS